MLKINPERIRGIADELDVVGRLNLSALRTDRDASTEFLTDFDDRKKLVGSSSWNAARTDPRSEGIKEAGNPK